MNLLSSKRLPPLVLWSMEPELTHSLSLPYGLANF